MDDLIVEFITETGESLSLLDSELVKLEQNPQDSAILSNIFRIVHTIKGTCGFLGLPRLEHVAHASENVLGKIRDKELEATPEAITLILESLDNIKSLLDYLSENGEEQAGDDEDLISRLNQFAETGSLGRPTAPVSANANISVSDGEAMPTKEAGEEISAPAIEGTTADEDHFPHFKGDDDPFMVEAMAKMAAEEAAKNATPTPEVLPAEPVAVATTPAPTAKAKQTPAKTEDKKTEEKKLEDKDGGANQSIRVSIDVLENLMQMVSELVLTRNQLMQIVRTKNDKELATPLQQLSHITSELQDGVMKTRMQPIGNAWSKFPRLIRDLSLELGKKIELKMYGAETELDRQLLEVIKDPLTHMVRNSCDHGLEPPAERLAAGKPELGTVTLSAYHEGGHIIIDIIDDGRGINIERVKQKALANGIASEEALAAMTDKQIAQFIFAAGFSTAEKVTSVSGRGVGMDVVKTNIQKIGGAIDLDSLWGKGSKISVKIPLTLAIVSVLIVEANGQKFAIPQINVLELVRAGKGCDINIETINNALVMRLRDKLLPLAVMSEILGFPKYRDALLSKEVYIVVCKVGSYDFGILVDRVYDTEEIVVKPVSEILKTISIYAGNTILGDGSVIMILDPNGIARSISSVDIAAKSTEQEENLAEKDREKTVPFLSFLLGKGAPKAVPLELVSRLEEIDVKDIEVAGDKPVVQYRGDLMRLITLDDEFSLPNSGLVDVVVFGYDKKVIGLAVNEIVDIVHAPFDIKITSKSAKQNGYLGSMVVCGKTTDIVDIGYLLADLVEDAVADIGAEHLKKATEKSILLVEDSPFFRNLTVPMLSAVGYKVTTAENGKEALDILGRGMHFDIVISDIEMPVMDGFEFAAACHKDNKINGTPIIAYTASLSQDVMEKSKAVGMRDCITKTDRIGLLDSIAYWLSKEKEVAA